MSFRFLVEINNCSALLNVMKMRLDNSTFFSAMAADLVGDAYFQLHFNMKL